MNNRDDQQNRRPQDNRDGNQNRGQDRESRYRGAYRFDDHRTTRDQHGDLRDNHRDDRGHADQRNTYGASNNYGNMGSYGGAQGFGSSRGGYSHPEHRDGFNANSGHGGDNRKRPVQDRRVYGAYWDRNSFSQGEHSRFADEHREHRPDPNRNRRDDRNREDDSRYEIYDDQQSYYNRGMYGNYSDLSVSNDVNRNMDVQPGEEDRYGSRQRARNRQGSGNDQDRYQDYGTRYNEGNSAGSLSYGYDGYRGFPGEDRNRHYDPMSGRAHRNENGNQSDDRRRQEGSRSRGGYGANNQSPDERNQNR